MNFCAIQLAIILPNRYKLCGAKLYKRTSSQTLLELEQEQCGCRVMYIVVATVYIPADMFHMILILSLSNVCLMLYGLYYVVKHIQTKFNFFLFKPYLFNND